jgi:phage-related protein
MADPAIGNVTEFIEQAAATRDAFQKNNEKADDLQDDIDKLEDKIEEDLNKFSGDVKKFTEDFGNSHDETCNGLEELIKLLEELATTRLGDMMETFQDVGDDIEQDCSKHRQELEGEFKDLEDDGYGTCDEGVNDTEGLVSRLVSEAKQAFDDMESHVGSLENMTTQFKDASVGVFSMVDDTVSDTLTNAVQSGRDMFESGLNAGFDTMESGLTGVMGLVEGGFSAFEGGFGQLGDMLSQMGGKILGDCVDNIADNLMESMQEMFTNMLESVLEGLVQEFIEAAITMGVGSAITTAVSPYAPIIIAAYNVLKIINEILNMLGGL